MYLQQQAKWTREIGQYPMGRYKLMQVYIFVNCASRAPLTMITTTFQLISFDFDFFLPIFKLRSINNNNKIKKQAIALCLHRLQACVCVWWHFFDFP